MIEIEKGISVFQMIWSQNHYVGCCQWLSCCRR